MTSQFYGYFLNSTPPSHLSHFCAWVSVVTNVFIPPIEANKKGLGVIYKWRNNLRIFWNLKNLPISRSHYVYALASQMSLPMTSFISRVFENIIFIQFFVKLNAKRYSLNQLLFRFLSWRLIEIVLTFLLLGINAIYCDQFYRHFDTDHFPLWKDIVP